MEWNDQKYHSIGDVDENNFFKVSKVMDTNWRLDHISFANEQESKTHIGYYKSLDEAKNAAMVGVFVIDNDLDEEFYL